TGIWPKPNTGPVQEQPGEWWRNVDAALRQGRRGLPGNSSLAKLFAQRLGLRTRANPPRLTEAGILAWADAHWERTGSWPNRRSGLLVEAPGETWHALDTALQQGHRGLRGKSSLAQLLGEHRGIRTRARLPCLTLPQILRWALGNYHRQGNWPTARSGAVAEECGETWSGIDTALRKGLRGLPGGLSLAQLLEPTRGQRED
ncbi:MAG TPA: hypothetical protein VKU02_29300, partial [Gemmataceae bacterium]|nr:hypothetical protein [Gemmataceae bacterium]